MDEGLGDADFMDDIVGPVGATDGQHKVHEASETDSLLVGAFRA